MQVDHSLKSHRTVISCGAVYFVIQWKVILMIITFISCCFVSDIM